MRGTLFSADFVKDFGGDLRLLELNTDTGFIQSSLQYFDFTEFANVLNTNSITNVRIVYKLFQNQFVELLEDYLADNVPGVTSFVKVVEEPYAVYPTIGDDAADTFILRLAYDQAAIFDSKYCANTVDTYKLFHEYNDLTSISEFSYKTADFEFNNLPVRFNPANLPDFVAKKNSSAPGSMLEFNKVGTAITVGSTDTEKLQSYIDSFADGEALIQPFYNNPEDTKSKAIRNYSIFYAVGGNMEVLSVGSFECEALLEKPTSITFDSSAVKNVIGSKHYYELTTNFLKSQEGGVFEGQDLVKSDGTGVLIEDAIISEQFKSFTIPGSPDSDDINIVYNWRNSGSEYPSGSHEIATTLMDKTAHSLDYSYVNNVTLGDGSNFRLAPQSLVLVYDIEEDSFRYITVSHTDPTKYKIPNINGTLASITSNVVEILDGDYKVYTLNMEDTDNFFINNGGVSVVLHNGSCFVEGTLVTNGDGEQVKIETLKEGDLVQSAKIAEDGTIELQAKKLSGTLKVNKRVTYKVHVGGKVIEGTSTHPMYIEGTYLKMRDLQVGHNLTTSKGELVAITEIERVEETKTVYNLLGVADNRNYFVHDFLTSNKVNELCFIAGTKITLENGDIKDIENIVVGDVIVSYNEILGGQEPKEVVGVKSPIHDDLVKYTFSNGTDLTCTYDHPIYVNDLELASYKPEWTNERYELPSIVKEIKEGDIVHTVEKESNIEIVNIEILPRVETQTYIFSVDGNRNFYANEILVHNK